MGKYMLMPKLDMSMEDGVIVKWIKNVGDSVKRGDIVIEIETGKVSLEVDNPVADGVILAQYFEAGDEVDINVPIMYIGEESEIAPTKEEALNSEGSAPADTGDSQKAKLPEEDMSAAVSISENVDYDYDLVVIGGGPGGYVSAIRAAQLGARVALLEKDTVGGVCLNRGCIPTKALLKNAEALRTIKKSDEMGISVPSFSVDWSKVIDRKNSVVNTLTSGVSMLLKKNKVDYISGEARIIDVNEITIGDRIISSDNIVIATGSKSVNIPMDTDDSIKIYSSTELLNIEKLPQSLLIIGGGVIGVEMATIFNSFGVNVTIVELMDEILSPTDSSVKSFMDKELRSQGIEIFTGTKVSEIRNGKAILANDKVIECDGILVSVGRAPISDVFENIDISLNHKKFINVDEYMKTNIDNIFAIGDVTGKSLLAHTASKQGIVVAESLYGHKQAMEYNAIPSCIFTSPEAASVGMTEEEVKTKGISYKASTFPFSAIGKALAMNETKGFVKVIKDDIYGELLGIHIVGPHASDLIAEGTLAITAEATYETIAETIHAHPTLSESLMEACEAVEGKAIHF